MQDVKARSMVDRKADKPLTLHEQLVRYLEDKWEDEEYDKVEQDGSLGMRQVAMRQVAAGWLNVPKNLQVEQNWIQVSSSMTTLSSSFGRSVVLSFGLAVDGYP